MKRSIWLIAATVLVLSIGAVAAGKDYKCDASTQDCLDKMAAHYQAKGWIGIKIEHNAKDQLVVKEVIHDSPAETAGLKAGDVLLAMNGLAYGDEASEKKMKQAKMSQKPGVDVTYTVARSGKKKDITITLAKVPQDVLAQWIGGHMLDHAQTEIAQN